jgi:hypothetical protein
MRCPPHISQLRLLILAFFVLQWGAVPTHAMTQTSAENIQAAMQTLSFLESLPKEGPIVVGVVYPSDGADAQAVAEATAQLIGSMHGPNSRVLQPMIISTNDLAREEAHLDVLFLVVGAPKHSSLIMDTIRRHRLVTASWLSVASRGRSSGSSKSMPCRSMILWNR